ncbi:Prp9p-like splicing factor 3a subunit 3 C-terminal C2H2 [Cryptosporidium sp. chipmunk genotype I]|uniref:Prp9p-like splicing factor 3a subunit 3 C-terminal C2H2 n=1 Tax=Cryptosporidium sp. chipmunk genotype I TaxID=1280935 RepID=UPI00351A4401|nr:Prp9p-like splicing factor 3a subunit 3 C-terminal C2H2 [Cryptosporidium sp. chipmunk genotype I]
MRIQSNSKEILSLYLDKSGERKREISYIGGSSTDGKLLDLFHILLNSLIHFFLDKKSSGPKDSLWTNFYNSIKSATSSEGTPYNLIRQSEYDIRSKALEELVLETIKGVELDDIFIPEEDLGRRLCLEQHYSRYINLKKLKNYRETTYINAELERLRRKGRAVDTNTQAGIVFEEMDFDTYLKIFDKFSSIPRYFKYRDNDYDEYITNLLEYLGDFFLRIHPLLDEGVIQSELNKDFEQAWGNEVLTDWRVPTNEMLYYSKPFDKLFFSEGTFNSHVKSKHYRRENSKYMELSDEEKVRLREKSLERDKGIARKEFLISKFSQLLSIQRREAIDHVNKLQSSTREELEIDRQLEMENRGLDTLIAELNDSLNRSKAKEGRNSNKMSSETDSDDDFDELQEKVYNPLKLPLGPDGRPMPYWLYKLNGLGIEFKCEICGNCSYWGRRAFERHFSETKHANGLSALGIPNTCHFKEITKISDAQELYSALCKQAKDLSFDDQNYVEMEDSQGNILPLKSFQDLYRQGLIY